jgi:Zn-dependent protease with chaperone function
MKVLPPLAIAVIVATLLWLEFRPRHSVLPVVSDAMAKSTRADQNSSSKAAAKSATEERRPQAAVQYPVLRYPAFVSYYDLASHRDLYYMHLLSPLTTGDDLAEWSLLREARKALKGVVGNALDAQTIIATISTAMPIEGTKPLAPIDNVVAECARILKMPKPAVFVRNWPFTEAYGAGFQDPHVLVLTSSLLALFSDRPDELRFIIGRELGHIKCKHMQMRAAGMAVLMLLSKIDTKFLQDRQLLPPLAFGRFCSWCREAEISADRAGLLCCQDPQVAYDAMARLLVGLNAKSDWIDPSNPHFDADRIIQDFQAWESRPFVELLMSIQNGCAQQPFVPERMAALKTWWQSGAPSAVLGRTKLPEHTGSAQITMIVLKNLCSDGETVNPYLKVIHREKVLFVTPKIDAARDAAWEDINQAFECEDGEPIFFEIWNAKYWGTWDSLIGLSVIHPQTGVRTYDATIHWDVFDRTSTQRIGSTRVGLEFPAK